MRQPSTGVRGVSDMAMLSSLLNISDSVPPIHARSATTSHFFQRDLGTKTEEGGAGGQALPFSVSEPQTASRLSRGQPGPSLPP